MSSSIHNLEIIPEAHPLYGFLKKLPPDEACDPNPDWIEQGSSKRYLLSFRGDNASARQRSLCELLSREQPWICKVSSHSGPGNSCVIIFLQDFRPGSELQPLDSKTFEGDDWEPNRGRVRHNVIPFPKPEQLALPEPEEKVDIPIPGCKQMETYD